jgi:predicted MFS family arabinose efflux permease
MGIHKVLYPWLVVGVLHESPSRLGVAQLALLLPNLLFILPGGVVSDRSHRGTWLSLLFLLFLLPLGLLMVAVISGELSFTMLLLFGITFGSLLAFVQPARESLLGYAAPELMHQAVAKVMATQFIAQGIGFLIAGQLGNLSLPELLAIQIVIFVLSSILIKRSHPLPKQQPEELAERGEVETKSVKQTLLELGDGLQLFRDDKGLIHLLLIVFATGFLAFGVYLVGMPLIAREFYNGGAELYAALQVVFSLGIVSANLGVMKQAKLNAKPGRLMVVSFLLRGSLVGVYVWGFFSGLSMTLGRTILHNQVSHAMRSRAASVYQLCLLAGAPLGAWVCGLTIEGIGLSSAFVLIAGATLLVSVLTAVFSPLWHLKAVRSA